jgi:hypothetical protein
MVFGSIGLSSRGNLSPQQALHLANIHLENAFNTHDQDIALVLCQHTQAMLSQSTKALKHAQNQAMAQTAIEGIRTAYIDLGQLFQRLDHVNDAQDSFKKATKLG